MNTRIISCELRYEHDVVLIRRRAREIAGLLGFEAQDQTRIATAVSEIARNAFEYAHGGKVEFRLNGSRETFQIIVQDRGPGFADLESVLSGRYRSRTGMGLGIVGAKRLMDDLQIETSEKGSRVVLEKLLPGRPQSIRPDPDRIADELNRREPTDPFQEIQAQNQELLRALEELRERKEELERLNRELDDTNRGVVALYAELDERADFLRRANEVKSAFLSNMSHEFRTPLNSVLSLSRLLLDGDDGELSLEQQRQVTYIQKSAENLSELVNDLLDMAKVEAGKVSIRPRIFSVSTLFATLRGMLRPLLVSTSVSLVFDEPDEVLVLETDEGKVSQILRNLISNALKFTEGGEVRVSARSVSAERIVFTVADTGIGIAPNDLDRIFDEYVQVENPIQNRVKGTGLGLPLSKRYAELLGGRIQVKSDPGIGSEFSITIPARYQGAAEVAFAPEVSREREEGRLPILIVEDNREALFAYDKYLKGTGFQPIPARTLREARQALREFRPAAIILDVLLQDESTWELLTELKRNTETRDIPVFVVTVVDNREKALALRADGFCAKPVDRVWLLDSLNASVGPWERPGVLVIDDDEVSRYLIRGALSNLWCVVSEAAAGCSGIELAEASRPDLIILDLLIPDLSGEEVLRRLKANPVTREIPVIIHSSQPLSDTDRARLLELAEAFVPKGDTARETLKETVGTVLGQRLRPDAQGKETGECPMPRAS